jgi:poly(A) polymerase
MKRITAKWLKAPGLQSVFGLIAAAGGEARVAGGALRNALMGEPVGDIDLATTLEPQRVMDVFLAAGHSAHPTGIEHGTVTAVVDNCAYQVTTLRRDVATDGRRAVVSFTDSWAGDALRRDFTMNALYCDSGGKVYDYTNGYDDILRRRIRFVGAPSGRIKEDYLRILRFFRFLSVYPDLKAETAGLAACVRMRKGLQTLSAERIAQEMLKLLAGANAVPVLKLMARNGVLKYVISFRDEFRTIARLPPDPILRAVVLAKDPISLQQDWRLSNEQGRRIENLLGCSLPTAGLRENEQRRILYHVGAETWRDSVRLAWARSRAPLSDRAWKRMVALPSRWQAPRFPVSGHDLIELGHTSGPALGQALRRLEDDWIAADFKPAKHDLLERLKGY